MFTNKFLLTTLFAYCLLFLSCGGLQNLNLFSIEDDIALGRQFSQEIRNNPQQFPILPEQGNEEVYRYVRNMTNRLLSTGQVAYRNEFAWEVTIIDDDETLNAFAVPGGYLYVYTGLIKFLDTEDQLAGVMGHEIAHAAQRHSTQQMTRVYGLDVLRQIVTGKSDPGVLEQVALSLATLKNSRAHESEADKYSVIYMCQTSYNAAGAAGFFEKIQNSGSGAPPEFLSTHPDPGNRVRDINARANDMSCRGSENDRNEHQRIKSLLR